MNMNFLNDLSMLSANYAGGSRGQYSSCTALRAAVRRLQVECQKVWKFSAAGVSGVENGMSNILLQVVTAFWYAAQIDEPLCASLCANERGERLMCLFPSCITASHGWMKILPIKSRAGQQSSCTRFLNERSSSVTESLMHERLLCQSDETIQT